MAQDLLTFTLYPALAIISTFCLWIIASELEKIRKKK